ncbi:hypothetical protein LOTGIDRAFT_166775 [Lottia gigantea]|uniref:Uncharacterized protein n=1 Tax=Lottia gigantea TaxID=225164 RepID=V4BDK8_LOTGI|nr:hypothetical protein LOTGIDRAFT_166775 [Lottia gigantea]ESO86774.1 hypothetical protein LOTGIDRAFT_166775 [Lottia gigantea]
MYNRLRKPDASSKRKRFNNEQWRESCSKSFEKLDKTDVKHLFEALRLGKIHLVKFILDATENKLQNCRDIDGRTPLIASCLLKEESTRDQLTKLLLGKNANVNLVDSDGRSALSHACERKCNDIVLMLIQVHNIDPDFPDKSGNTPLIYCAREGNDVALEILVKSFRRLGLKVDHVNDQGFSALLEAARNTNLTCAQILVAQGRAQKSLRDKQTGRTAAEWFQSKGYERSDLSFLCGNAKFVRAVKLTSILKSKTFGVAKPAATQKRHSIVETHEKKRVKHRSKSVTPRPKDVGLCELRRKARYHKQRSADSQARDVVLEADGPVTMVTTVISTLTEFGKLSLNEDRKAHKETASSVESSDEMKALLPVLSTIPIPASETHGDSEFLSIGRTDI